MNNNDIECKTKTLVQIIENIWGYEESSAALLELYDLDRNKALELGMDILKNNKGDDYLQATVLNIIYDIDPQAVISTLYKRAAKMGKVLLEEIRYEAPDHFINIYKFNEKLK